MVKRQRISSTIANAAAAQLGREVVRRIAQNLPGSNPGQASSETYTGTITERTARGDKVRILTKQKKKKRKKQTLKSRINRIENKIKDEIAFNHSLHLEKSYQSTQLSCAVNSCAYLNEDLLTKSEMQAITDQLSVMTTGTTESSIDLGSKPTVLAIGKTMECVVRNNGKMPVDLTYYEYECMDNTSVTPTSLIDNFAVNYGVLDFATNLNFTMNFALCKTEARKVYKKLKETTTRLNAGDELRAVCSTGWKECNMADIALLAENVKKITKYIVWRVQGVVAHDDTVTGNVGISDGTVDIVYHNTWKVKYDGNGGLRDQGHNNFLDSLTTAVCDGPNVIEIARTL